MLTASPDRTTAAHLSKIHSLPSSDFSSYISSQNPGLFSPYAPLFQKLAELLEGKSLYKYNGLWSRDLQTASQLVLIERWANSGALAKRPEVQSILGIGADEKTEEGLRITDEEYLHSCVGLIDELSRLCVNVVIMGEYKRATEIAGFVKELSDAFRVLNLKNDSLRKRVDGLKYAVKKCEDVVYDLRLRNLVGDGKEGEN